MLSRHSSVALSEVIDISSDTDSDDGYAPSSLFVSQSTLGPSLSSGSFNHRRLDAMSGASFTSSAAGTSRVASKGNPAAHSGPSTSGSGLPTMSRELSRASSLLSVLDSQSSGATPGSSSPFSSQTASAASTPVKRPRAKSSSATPGTEEDIPAPPPKKRKLPQTKTTKPIKVCAEPDEYEIRLMYAYRPRLQRRKRHNSFKKRKLKQNCWYEFRHPSTLSVRRADSFCIHSSKRKRTRNSRPKSGHLTSW